MYKPFEKKKFNHVDNQKHWPASIKYTIRWFPLLAIMEHTSNILKPNKSIIPLLLRVFAMFGLHPIDDKN